MTLKKNKMNLSEVEILKNGKVDPEEIKKLRASVGWDNQEELNGRILKNTYLYYIARQNDRLIGFISVISDGVADAMLLNLMIHPELQGQGIGTYLVQQVIKDLQAEGIRCIHVTFEENLEDFYKQFGFFIFKGGIIDFDNMKIEL